MFCATFSKGRWRPSCSAKLQKETSKWINAKIIDHKAGTILLKDFCRYYTLLFVVKVDIFTGLFLLNFKTTHCKNYSGTNLVKIN